MYSVADLKDLFVQSYLQFWRLSTLQYSWMCGWGLACLFTLVQDGFVCLYHRLGYYCCCVKIAYWGSSQYGDMGLWMADKLTYRKWGTWRKLGNRMKAIRFFCCQVHHYSGVTNPGVTFHPCEYTPKHIKTNQTSLWPWPG